MAWAKRTGRGVHVVGTAGHVDHGKSSLVRALTGVDPDRWIEEKLRGMTLDLGFAHLRYPDGIEAGIVDVPGHERFLHNMLAGAAGMELLLLVVAANEGPKPQTIEHLAILSYLNVRRALVVLTKADLVDTEALALAENLVSEAVRGTVADGAPVLAVSTVTLAGIDALRAAIHDALRDMPARAPQAAAYLPIDRVFSLPGHGTIVTGTLMQGALATGDELLLTPLERTVRARSLQVFGERRDRVDGGARVAVNIPGIEVGEVARGAVLASAQYVPAQTFDVTFAPYAPSVRMLRRKNPVRVYIGSAEVLGTLAFDATPATADPLAGRLFLRRPAIGLPGAAFVVRRMSPKDLLGGGTFSVAVVDGIAGEADDAATRAVLAALAGAGIAGANAERIGALANVREDAAEKILARLVSDGRAARLAKPAAYVDVAALRAFEERVRAHFASTTAATPWMMGSTSLALSRALGVDEPLVVRLAAALADDGRIAARAGYYADVDFVPRFTPEQQAFFDRELAVDPQHPMVPAALPDIVAHLRAARIVGLSQAFDTLVASGAAVKVGNDVYRGTQIAEIRGRLETALKRDRQITAAGFRDLVGTSRKYIVPLLEWFDATGVTVRAGDLRMLRAKAE
jgi:selenocysteine-specific elongation factor